MRIDRLNETAWIVSELGRMPAYLLASKLESLHVSDEIEFVPCYKTVGIYGISSDPRPLLDRALAVEMPESIFKEHRIPVLYDGEDLNFVASELGLSADEVARLHTGQVYRCFAIGFQPGFPYLGYLGGGLSGLPRRASPSVRVPKGSVAIALDQTGIYPAEVPGGWHLLGRTPLSICDPSADFFPIAAGDTVEFFAVNSVEFEEMKDERL